MANDKADIARQAIRNMNPSACFAEEGLFAIAFNTSPIAYSIAAPEDGFHYAVNKAWTELLGYSHEEALAKSALDLDIWPDLMERERFVAILRRDGSAKAFETKFRRKDGEIIDVMAWGGYVMFDGKHRLFNAYDNITARKQAERKLSKQTLHMNVLKSIAYTANQSADIVIALNQCLEQICLYNHWMVGRVFLLGNNRALLARRNVWYVVPQEALSGFCDLIKLHEEEVERDDVCPSLLADNVAHREFDITAAAGAFKQDVVRRFGLKGGISYPIKIQNNVVGLMEFYAADTMVPDGAMLDLLDESAMQMGRVIERANTAAELMAHRTHLEELVKMRTIEVEEQAAKLELALNKEKELNMLQRQFVAMASHEFRTPLTIIDNAAQLLKRGAETVTPETALKRAERIRDAVSRMTQLMESTLAAARMQDGGIQIKIESCDIKELLVSACQRQQEICRKHIITCDLVDFPDSIQADASALDQVFTNLLSNAVKYAPKAPLIEVTGECDGRDIVVRVRDHGIGIDADELEKIGERFFRARTSTGIAGTGIGLNLVHKIVGLHQGVVSVESKKGTGSVFIIRLPIAGPTIEAPAERIAS